MAIILRAPLSPLGQYLVPFVKEFLITNQKTLIQNPTELTPEIGAESLANTISYAVSKAFESPLVIAAFALGNVASCVTPPGPGPLIISAINVPPIEI
jgi:hypothetical protein